MRQQGFSLIEQMVALVVGMIVVGGAIAIYTSTYGANSDALKMARLNNDLRTIMTYLTRDLRRASHYDWTLAELTAGNFTVNPHSPTVVQPLFTGTTAVVSYDLDDDGNNAEAASETYRFQWVDSNGDGNNDTIQAKIGNGNWTNLNDPTVVIVSNVLISETNTPTPIINTGSGYTVTVPTYSIVLTGQLVRDSTVQRTIRETVRVRNEVIQ
jgi:type IV pilus assembly protein PilW